MGLRVTLQTFWLQKLRRVSKKGGGLGASTFWLHCAPSKKVGDFVNWKF